MPFGNQQIDIVLSGYTLTFSQLLFSKVVSSIDGLIFPNIIFDRIL
jgi:hypothetical protein